MPKSKVKLAKEVKPKPSPSPAKSKSVPHPRHRFNPARGVDRKTFPKKCKYCDAKQSSLSKNGFDKDGRRMYRCKECRKSFYHYKEKKSKSDSGSKQHSTL